MDPERHAWHERITKALSGAGCRPFTPRELAALKPDELDRLRTASGQRFLALSPEQRETLKQHLFLVLVTLSHADYQAIANYAGRKPETVAPSAVL